MVFSFYAVVSIAAILGVSVHHVELSPVTGQSIPTTKEPTAEDVDSDNSTEYNITAYQSTNYMYLDFPRIGYRIFLKKMLEALRILNYFMKMDPMVLRLTRTYLFFNTTGSNTTDLQLNDTVENSDNLETNTEAPPYYLSADKPSESDTDHQAYETLSINQPEEKEKSTKQDDVKQSKVEPEGFFSKVGGAIGKVFQALTNWI